MPTTAFKRRVFFSLHYDLENWRTSQVRISNVVRHLETIQDVVGRLADNSFSIQSASCSRFDGMLAVAKSSVR